MRVLVLGGTRFLGRHLVEVGTAAGHEITLFHRGIGGCSLHPEVEHVHGDRDGDLGRLAGRRWDVVVDTSGYVPRLVGMAAGLLREAVDHYVFVSSISVYPEFTAGMDESSPVAVLDNPATEEVTGETYGGLKALCEQAAEDAMPGRVLVVRAGMLVGRYDNTDRFTYWVRRVPMGGRVLVAAPRERPVQLVHAGDLAAWMLRAAEARIPGVFHGTGPEEPLTLERVLAACREAGGGNAEPVWVDPEFVESHGVGWWSELPFCIDAENLNVMAVDVSKAVAAGLTYRSLMATIRDVITWDTGRPPGTELGAGLKASREAELLRLWDEGGG